MCLPTPRHATPRHAIATPTPRHAIPTPPYFLQARYIGPYPMHCHQAYNPMRKEALQSYGITADLTIDARTNKLGLLVAPTPANVRNISALPRPTRRGAPEARTTAFATQT